MEKNKILPIISILFTITIIVILAVWLISAQQKLRPEDIVEEQEEEEFVFVEPIDEEAETDKETKAPFPAEEIENDIAFQEVIFQLNTPQKLIDYLNENFSFEEKESDQSLAPQEFFELKKGNSWDFAVFVSYILWNNKYESSIIRYKYDESKINTVIVFRDTDLPKTIILTENGATTYSHGWSFEEMFQKEEKRLDSKITGYAVSYWTDKGELWPEEWIKRQF